jgi:hypothetical protein
MSRCRLDTERNRSVSEVPTWSLSMSPLPSVAATAIVALRERHGPMPSLDTGSLAGDLAAIIAVAFADVPRGVWAADRRARSPRTAIWNRTSRSRSGADRAECREPSRYGSMPVS